MTPGAAKLLLDIKRADIQKPLKALHEKYEAALNRLEETEQSKGNLEAILLLKKEREKYQARADLPKPTPLPALNNLREIYHRELESFKETRKKAESVAFAHYRTEMGKIISELTREGKVEEAIKARDILAEVGDAESISITSEDPAEQIVVGEEENYTTTPQLTVVKEDKLFILSSAAKDGEALRSKRTFKTPFTLQARSMTDGNSIRLYFGQRGIVVFNWEGNPKELRVNDPVGRAKHGISDTKPLDPNRMYDLEIQVTESKIVTYVGKRKYGEVDGDFTEAEGTVGIGPAFGSKVSIERFVVTQLDSNL